MMMTILQYRYQYQYLFVFVGVVVGVGGGGGNPCIDVAMEMGDHDGDDISFCGFYGAPGGVPHRNFSKIPGK